jgi:hypothetical protein
MPSGSKREAKTRITMMSLVEQELLTLPEHLSPSPVFSGARVTRSLVFCVCFAPMQYFKEDDSDALQMPEPSIPKCH